MMLQMEDSQVDLASNTLKHRGTEIPLSLLGVGADTLIVDLPFKLKDTFDKLNGKFSSLFTNSAIVDCHYIFPNLIAGLETSLEGIKFSHPIKYIEAKAALSELKSMLEKSGETFCDFAYDLNGVLKDQSSYYIDSYA